MQHAPRVQGAETAGNGAEVRVNWTRRVIKELQRSAPAAHEHVLERMGATHRQAIDEAGILAWLPCEHHLALCEQLRAELGDRGLVDHFADTTLAAGKLPLFRGLAEASLRLFGTDPGAIIKSGPQAWRTIFRNMGSLENAPGEAPRSVVTYMQVTDRAMHQDETFALGLEGGLWACLRLTGHDGEVEADMSDYRRSGKVVFTTRW